MRVFPTSIQFGEAMVSLQWLDETSVREPGLVRSHYLEVPADTVEFADEVDDLLKAVEVLLKKALVVWDDAPTAVEVEDSLELDDDGPGPYDNPNERDLPEQA